MKKVVVLTFAFAWVIAGGESGLAEQLPAPIAQTGQVECYDDDGNPIDCSGTGQDGEYLMGVAWPDPRFDDNGDGTITDNLTGLTWLQLVNCFGKVSWGDALLISKTLDSGECGLSDGSLAGDWRLPNANELMSIVHFGESEPSLDPSHNFFGVQLDNYWTSTTLLIMTDTAWTVHLAAGVSPARTKTEAWYVWPVRGASSAASPAPVPVTGLTSCWDEDGGFLACSGTGQDGEHQAGVPWPSPRFTDNGDGTVLDHLTGLVWLRDANCFGTTTTWQGALDEANLLQDGSCGLSDQSTEGDWRLPNVREIASLVNYGVVAPALPFPHPFVNVETLNQYGTSTSHDRYPSWSWYRSFNAGSQASNAKTADDFLAWPVRGEVSQVFLDGFESGDTSAWSATMP